MNSHAVIEQFWQAYPASRPAGRQLSTPEAWGFGDSPQMADELGALVMAGVKTATCSALWEYESDGEPLPQVGGLSIILDGAGQPLCVIETLSVEVVPYNQVDAGFAAAEGEGDRSLSYWRAAHRRFFSRTLPAIGRQFDESMPLVCERFQVVFRRPGKPGAEP